MAGSCRGGVIPLYLNLNSPESLKGQGGIKRC